MRSTRLKLRLLLVLALLPAGLAHADRTPEESLAMQLWRSASLIMSSTTDLSLSALGTALVLVEEAVALDPDNAELWRYLSSLAVLAERRDLIEEATRNVIRLDPRDDVVRLRRLTLALDEYQTVEERVAAHQRLLEPTVRDQIGDPVASRIAFDLALLQRRAGDLDAFAESLSQAVALDPSNRKAAALAAGFFRMHVEDVVGEAELLTALMLADPTDVPTQVALAELLLDSGAFSGAERLYGSAIAGHLVLGRQPPPNLIADQAVAQWGNRHGEVALDTIRFHQRQADEVIRARAFSENPALSPVQRKRIYDHLHPNLATVRAAILASQEDENAPRWVARVLEAYEKLLQMVDQNPDDEIGNKILSQLRGERAWVAAWLSDDPDAVDRFVAEIERFQPLSEESRTKYEGWMTLKRGAPEAALDIFARMQPTGAAALGEAQAYLALGERRDAARSLLEAARLEPGSLIGIWARDQLEAMLGQRLPLSPTAARLEALLAEVPTSFEGYADSPTLALGFDVEPSKLTYAPYEAIIINVSITNNSPYPLAIDRDGPIRPQVVLFFSTSLGRIGQNDQLPPVVVDLDRRLRLEPYERVTVPVDLRRYKLGDVLASRAYRGTFVRVKGMMNTYARADAKLKPGLLGAEEWTPTVRVDGWDRETERIQQAIVDIQDPVDFGDLETMALLSQMIGVKLPATAPPEVHDLFSAAASSLIAAYERLDPVSQAWLLGAMPSAFTLPEIRASAAENDHRLVRISYLLFQLGGPDDLVLLDAKGSGDANVAYIARRSEEMLRRIAEMNRYAQPAAGTP